MTEVDEVFAPDETSGAAMHNLASRLFPIHRSLTGDGVRETLGVIGEYVPLAVHEVPSGTPLFDWTIPPEWNVRDAFVEDSSGHRVIDVRRHPLALVGYSSPIAATLTRAELEPHLHSLPDQPDTIPYRTSYHHRTWGFCLPHRQRVALADDRYRVVIDATLVDGSLTYAQCVLAGRTAEEVVLYTHTCHPGLANDNLSGIVVCTFLARWIAARERRYTYRFIFGPGTLGSLAWLNDHRGVLPDIRHGLVAVLLGHGPSMRYKRSRHGDREIDRVAAYVLQRRSSDVVVENFSPVGYDERQFGAPGFDLPVGRLSRATPGGYAAYHTSADDLTIVTPAALADSLAAMQEIVDTLEHNGRFRNTSPYGEPQLGRRGLYSPMGGPARAEYETALLWVLNLSDGSHSLVDIATRSALPFQTIRQAADALVQTGLLARADPVGERRA